MRDAAAGDIRARSRAASSVTSALSHMASRTRWRPTCCGGRGAWPPSGAPERGQDRVATESPSAWVARRSRAL